MKSDIGLSWSETGIKSDIMYGLEYKHFNALCFIKNIVGNKKAVCLLRKMASRCL